MTSTSGGGFNRCIGFCRSIIILTILSLAGIAIFFSSCGSPDFSENTLTLNLNEDGRSGSISHIMCLEFEDNTQMNEARQEINYNNLSSDINYIGVTVRIWEPDKLTGCYSWKAEFSDPLEIDSVISIVEPIPFSIVISEAQSTVLKTTWSISINAKKTSWVIPNGSWIIKMPGQIKEVTIVPDNESKKVSQKISAAGKTLELTFPNQIDKEQIASEFIIVSVDAEESRFSSLIILPIVVGLACSVIFGIFGYFVRQFFERRMYSKKKEQSSPRGAHHNCENAGRI